MIPGLLLHKKGLVKSVRFKDYKYVGDPMNAVRIFNNKEVDELAILDIDASRENRSPDLERIAAIVSEAFMPIAYGGGISRIEDAEKILMNGAEKVIVNKSAIDKPSRSMELSKISPAPASSICFANTTGSRCVFNFPLSLKTFTEPKNVFL